MAEASITVRMDVEEAEAALARLEQRAEAVERRVAMAIARLERSEGSWMSTVSRDMPCRHHPERLTMTDARVECANCGAVWTSARDTTPPSWEDANWNELR